MIPIDSIMEIFKDYCRDSNDIPADAMPLSLQIKPSEQGMFAILAESESWTNDTPLRINFDIKRVFSV